MATQYKTEYKFSDNTVRIRRNMIISTVVMWLFIIFELEVGQNNTMTFANLTFKNVTETKILWIVIFINIYNIIRFSTYAINDNLEILLRGGKDSPPIQIATAKINGLSIWVLKRFLILISRYHDVDQTGEINNYNIPQKLFLNIEYRLPLVVALLTTILFLLGMFCVDVKNNIIGLFVGILLFLLLLTEWYFCKLRERWKLKDYNNEQ